MTLLFSQNLGLAWGVSAAVEVAYSYVRRHMLGFINSRQSIEYTP